MNDQKKQFQMIALLKDRLLNLYKLHKLQKADKRKLPLSIIHAASVPLVSGNISPMDGVIRKSEMENSVAIYTLEMIEWFQPGLVFQDV